jgi:hypothetical protein
MNESEKSLIIDVLTDMQVEINAIHEALLVAEVEDLVLQGIRDDAKKDRVAIRDQFVERFSALQ